MKANATHRVHRGDGRTGVRTAVVLALWAASACFLAGCAGPSASSSASVDSFELLYERNLPAFEREIAAARHVGADGPWTRVGESWLDLVNCTGLERRDQSLTFDDWPDDEPLARLMYAALGLELRRQNALAVADASPGSAPFIARWAEDHFFARKPDDPGADKIVWPAEEERWPDEEPASVEVDKRCSELGERLLERAAEAADEETDSEELSPDVQRARWRRAQLEAIEALVEARERLPKEEAGGHIDLLVWRARVHGAHLHLALAGQDDEISDRQPETDLKEGLTLLEALEADGPAGPDAAARMLFLRARFLADLDRPEDALDDLHAALDLGLASHEEDAARYLGLTLLTDQARWDEALAIADGLPHKNAPIFGPYAYKKALAARQADREDRFLRVAVEALSSAEASSPFLGALYRDALEVLAGYPFDERVVEVVEDLGPPGQIYARLADLAQVGIEHDHPEHARQTARWLLERHRHPRYAPRYRALAATAAFMQDDKEAFRRQVRAMTRRNQNVDEALDERAADFYADADRTFSRLLTQVLPTMAEWDRTPADRRRRQRWLEITVDELQRFLRRVDDSNIESDLVELYRLASELLDEHPRGYASRVGKEESSPLILGTVEVGQSELLEEEPEIAPSHRQPDLLAPVPRPNKPAASWAFGFDDGQGDEARADSSTGGDDE